MPTYTPIQSIELSGNSTEVIFANIPQIYQDLSLVVRPRAESFANLAITVNGDTTGRYTLNSIRGNGTAINGGSDYGSRWEITRNTGVTSSAILINIIDFLNYSNTTTFKTIIGRSSQSDSAAEQITGCYQSTNAISSMRLYGPTFSAGSTFDLYGISPAAATNAQAAGGTDIVYDSTYVYHVFKSSGTFTPYRNLTADVLVIAGGGAGGWGYSGGGGAGGLAAYTSQSLTSNTSYTVTIGAGGAAATAAGNGVNGANSQFGSLTAAVGGGRGGSYYASGPSTGGSGGGGNGGPGGAGVTSGAAGTAGQGNSGGNGSGANGGGGGGAGAAGNAGNGSPATKGGDGSSSYSSWGLATSTGQNVSGTYYYAGGGGITGGNGGGGSDGGPGTTNTGGGGGAGDAKNSGGSGIVIVRYTR